MGTMLGRGDTGKLERLRELWDDIPSFAFLGRELPEDDIPSFIFHKVLTDEFEGWLRYLEENHYRTLAIDEYYDCLTGKKTYPGRKVLLTFDDGLRNNWSTAYPLLKKYGMKAVLYVNPGMMRGGGLGPTVEDLCAGKLSREQWDAYEAENPFIHWQEAREMESSGLVDVENHSWRHQICFVEDRIIDFQRPAQSGKPLYSWLHTAVDEERADSLWGAPVYPYKPRLVARRFFDDKGLRAACTDFVKARGGKKFFGQKEWPSALRGIVREYREKYPLSTRFEYEEEQELAIRDSLLNAKKEIEKELGKECRHFAYPWNTSDDLSLQWLKELEFKTVFRTLPRWRMPRVGANPYDLDRIEGYWIPSLPGRGRIGVLDKLKRRFSPKGLRGLRSF